MTPLLAHADWSVAAGKRWLTVAEPAGSGWIVQAEAAGALPDLLDRLRTRARGAPVGLGVDAPIGLPNLLRGAWTDFPAFLVQAAPPFFRVCAEAREISPQRPFYPQRPAAGQRRAELAAALGAADPRLLLRACDHPIGKRKAASSVLWTLGANQAGKAALSLWRELLVPALRSPSPPALWPFDGPLAALLAPGRTVIAETYPAEAMRQLGLRLGGSKRLRAPRQALAPALRAALAATGAQPHADLARSIEAGFDNDHQFDSLAGLLGLLRVAQNPTLDHLPDEATRRWEGWILGRPLNSD